MNFRQQVFQIVLNIPEGQVATYGQVAQILDKPRAARQVGWALASLYGTPEQEIVPWWRVVNAKGYLSIRGEDVGAKLKQKAMLISEGIEVDDEFMLDLEAYRWQPSLT